MKILCWTIVIIVFSKFMIDKFKCMVKTSKFQFDMNIQFHSHDDYATNSQRILKNVGIKIILEE